MYSPDGCWWWNGTEWVPAPTWRSRYEETPWTRRLQVAVLALQAVGLLGGAVTVPVILSQLPAMMAAQAAANGTPPPDAQTQQVINSILTGTLVFAGLITVALLVVIVVGVLKLWRWVYWYLVVTYAFAVLSVPANLTYVFGGGPIRLPAWILLFTIPLLLAEIGMLIWMLIAFRRFGTWARRKIVEPINPEPAPR